MYIEEGYYGSDTRRFSWGEFQRMSGRGVAGLIFGPFRSLIDFPPGYAVWLPTYWSDTFAEPEDISERGMEAILPFIAECEREGFCLITYQKSVRMIWPALLDNCGASMLHNSGEYEASIVYQKLRGGEASVAISIVFSCKSGKWIVVTNTAFYFDPVQPSKTIALTGASVKSLWQRAHQERDTLIAQGESITNYHTVDQWKCALDEHQLLHWHNRVATDLFG